jgi:hypothetical protein
MYVPTDFNDVVYYKDCVDILTKIMALFADADVV